MAVIQLNVLFKMLQRDDKKEVLEFHVLGENLPNSTELVEMAGSIAILEIEHSEAGEIPAEFKHIRRDSKKTVLNFETKGDSEDKVIKLYPLAGTNVNLLLVPSQMSIDDFYNEDQHEGIGYDVEGDGIVKVVKGQKSIFDDDDDSNVVPFDDDLIN